MKRLLLIAALLLPLSLFGAAGDITGVNVEANGWVLNCTYEGATNGVFDFGFLTNNTGPSRIILTVSSPGFDDTGTSNWTSRVVYGTKQLRLAYPQNAVNDVVTNDTAGTCVMRIALSDFIYANDTATFAISGGASSSFYVTGVTSNNAASGAVTINSTVPYPKCIANWTWPGWQRATGNTMRLRAVGFHQSAREGRPLRVMKFTVTGATSGVSVTNWVTQMTIDRTFGDAVPFGEYIADMDISGMTAKENVRCDFAAYPWLGDSTSIQDTSDNVWSLSAMYCSQTNLCDNAGTYGVSWALVASGGSDATGEARTNAVNVADPPPAFATINGACVGIKATNNAFFGHNDLGGGIVYLSESNEWHWVGTTANVSAKPPTWVTITRWPTNSIDQVVIRLQAGNKKLCDRDRIYGVTLMLTNATGGITGDEALWLDDCVIDSTNGVCVYINSLWYTTRCRVGALATGLRPYSTAATTPALIRGNWITNVSALVITTCGNNWVSAGTTLTILDKYGTVVLPTDRGIFYNNRLLSITTGASAVTDFGVSPMCITNGIAVVQNEIERVDGTSQPILRICGDTSASNTATNVIIWQNTVINDRSNIGYNDNGANNPYRESWSVKNNVIDDWNCKNDANFLSYDQARTNNWSVCWGAGFRANWFLETTGVGAPLSFTNEFGGLLSYNPTVVSPTTFAGFIGRLTGNYKIISSSPLLTMEADRLIPFDIEGNARGGFDPSGAYSSAAPRKGGGFF